VGGQHHSPDALAAGKPLYPFYKKLGRPRGRYGQARKIWAPTGIRSPTVQPLASRYTDYAIPDAKGLLNVNSKCMTQCYSKATKKNPMGGRDDRNQEFLLSAWCCIPILHPVDFANQSKALHPSEGYSCQHSSWTEWVDHYQEESRWRGKCNRSRYMWKASIPETCSPGLSINILFIQSLWPYTNEDKNNSLLTQNYQHYNDLQDITTRVTLTPPFWYLLSRFS
jgi:hypothetical protein